MQHEEIGNTKKRESVKKPHENKKATMQCEADGTLVGPLPMELLSF